MRLQALKFGVGPQDFVDDKGVANLIKAVLPHQADLVDKFGAPGYFLLVEQLEAKLIQDLKAMLSGVEGDQESIEQAAEIVRRSNQVMRQAELQQDPP